MFLRASCLTIYMFRSLACIVHDHVARSTCDVEVGPDFRQVPNVVLQIYFDGGVFDGGVLHREAAARIEVEVEHLSDGAAVDGADYRLARELFGEARHRHVGTRTAWKTYNMSK